MPTEAPTIFESLPGQLMSVSEVTQELSKMWSVTPMPGSEAPSEFRASQMNLVLHFGLKTTTEEAQERFNTAIAFAQRYPCRIVVLCPMGREPSDRLLEGKLFAQCYVGESIRQMCCCEALMLGYPTRQAGFLSNQVSTWLENDLPTYHWFNRVPAERIGQMHMEFVKRCRRVVYDSDVEVSDFREIAWPRPQGVIDLAYARILPVRQTLGQFLSRYDTSKLVGGLKQVQARFSGPRQGEACNLLRWTQTCLEGCSEESGVPLEADFAWTEVDDAHSLEVEWVYEDSRHFLWVHEKEGLEATITADFGNGRISTPMQVALLSPDAALAEALFFSS